MNVDSFLQFLNRKFQKYIENNQKLKKKHQPLGNKLIKFTSASNLIDHFKKSDI